MTRMRIAALIGVLLMVAFALAPDTVRAQSRCPGGSVNVTPSTNLQTLINSSAAGTTYCLASGVYQGNITPKDNDRFFSSALHGAVFDGAYVREKAFISTFGKLTDSNVTGVTLDGLVVQRYRTTNQPFNNAAIDAGGGWKLLNLLVEDNTSGIIFGNGNWVCADNVEIRNNMIRNNTYVGMYYNGLDAAITGNTFLRNGWGNPSNSDVYWFGTIKVTNQGVNPFTSQCPVVTGTENLYIAYNVSVGNRAAGWWHDINVRNFVVELNTIQYNERWGIFHEISQYGGIIRNNLTECNGNNHIYSSMGHAWDAAEIFIVSSSNVTIEGNTVRVCAPGQSATLYGYAYSVIRTGRGITILAEGRGAANNNIVRNNIIIQQGSPVSWLATLVNNSSSQSNNIWSSNTYYVPNTSQTLWNHLDNVGTFSVWQGTHGRDTGSTQNTGSPPSGALPTLTPTPTQAVGAGTPTNTPAPTATPSQTPSATPGSGAYFGSRPSIASSGSTIIQAENFDWGAQGAAFNDTDTTNQGGSNYRGGAVDIKQVGSDYIVGYFLAGEWLSYSVTVASAGYYTIDMRGTGNIAGQRVQLAQDGRLLATIEMPATGDWNVYSTTSATNVYLNAGDSTIRLTSGDGTPGQVTYADVDWFAFTRTTGVTATPTFTLTPSITPTPSVTHTPSATHTPSITPTPAPSLTPVPTLDLPALDGTLLANIAIQSTALSNEGGTATAVATQASAAEATVSAQDDRWYSQRQCVDDAILALSRHQLGTPVAVPTCTIP